MSNECENFDIFTDFAGGPACCRRRWIPARIGGGSGAFWGCDGILSPLRGGGFLTWLSRGVAARHTLATIWHPSRMHPGGDAENPGIGGGFSSQDIGGDMVTRRDCPEYARGGGTRRGGVKAPEGWRSPRPGGITACLQDSGRLWRQRRGLSEENGEFVGMRKRPESGGGFSSQDIGGKLIMPRECPEIGKGEHGSPAVGTGAKNGTFLSSLPGLAPLRSGQPTVGNGGLLSVVPMGLQRRGYSRALP